MTQILFFRTMRVSLHCRGDFAVNQATRREIPKQLATLCALNDAMIQFDVRVYEAAQPYHQTEKTYKIDFTISDPTPQYMDVTRSFCECEQQCGASGRISPSLWQLHG